MSYSFPHELLSPAVKVIKQNGEEITNNIITATAYYWNKGKKTITKQDILKPLELTYSGNAEVIGCKIVKQSRDIVSANITKSTNDSNAVRFSFDRLECNDGFKMQVVLQGNEERIFPVLTGLIADTGVCAVNADAVTILKTSEKYKSIKNYMGYIYIVMKTCIWIAGVSLFLTILFTMMPEKEKTKYKYINLALNKLINVSMIIMVIILIASGITNYTINSQKYYFIDSGNSSIIPETIK